MRSGCGHQRLRDPRVANDRVLQMLGKVVCRVRAMQMAHATDADAGNVDLVQE